MDAFIIYAFVQYSQCVRGTPIGVQRLCITYAIRGDPHVVYGERSTCQHPKGWRNKNYVVGLCTLRLFFLCVITRLMRVYTSRNAETGWSLGIFSEEIMNQIAFLYLTFEGTKKNVC